MLMPSKAKGAHIFQGSQGTHAIEALVDNTGPNTPSAGDINETQEQDVGPGEVDRSCTYDEEEPEPASIITHNMPALSLSRKCTAAAPMSGSAPKAPQLSASAQGLLDIGKAINCFTDVIENILAPPPKSGLEVTPLHKKHAMLRAQDLEEEWLLKNELVSFINILKADVMTVDAYLVLKKDSLQKKWVYGELDKTYL